METETPSTADVRLSAQLCRNLVSQRRTYDCVLACLAMATGKNYEDLWPQEFCDAVEDAKGTSKNGLHDRALELAGLERGKDYISVYCGGFQPGLLRQMLWGRRACIQVPSLNHEGAQHFVYWDGFQLHDPSNKQRYQWLDHITPEWVTLLRHNAGNQRSRSDPLD